MAVSMFGSCGEKVGEIDLESGAMVLAYTASAECLFGVVMMTTQPRHYALHVLTQTGVQDESVGKPVMIRIARNEGDMTSQLPTVMPIASVEVISDVVGVWRVHDEGEQGQLTERVDLLRSISGLGSGLGPGPMPLPEVTFKG